MTCAEIWTLIITGLGVIATFAAVFVALYQSRIPFKKKLKLSCLGKTTTSVMATFGDIQKKYHFLSIKVVNLGNKAVTITNLNIKVNKEVRYTLLFLPNSDLLLEHLLPKFPHKLEPDENIQLNIKYDFFTKQLDDIAKEEKIKLNKKTVFEILDTTGKRYYIKSNKKIEDYLSKKNKNPKNENQSSRRK